MNHRLPLIVRIIFFASLCVALVVLDYRQQWLGGMRLGFSIITAPLYSLIDIPTDLVDWSSDQLTTKQTLEDDNKILHTENLFLKAKLQQYNELVFENQQLKKMFNTPYKTDDISLKLARIIEVNQSRITKRLIINEGVLNGVFVGQVVVGEQGIIGYVKELGVMQSQVLLISDPTHQIPVKSERNGLRGVASGQASIVHQMSLKFITNDADVRVGDVFVSSHLGRKFPAGFPVATVTDITLKPQQNFMEVRLKPIEKLSQLDLVLLLSNTKKDADEK